MPVPTECRLLYLLEFSLFLQTAQWCFCIQGNVSKIMTGPERRAHCSELLPHMAFWPISWSCPFRNWGFKTIVFYVVGLLTLCPTLNLKDQDFVLGFTLLGWGCWPMSKQCPCLELCDMLCLAWVTMLVVTLLSAGIQSSFVELY